MATKRRAGGRTIEKKVRVVHQLPDSLVTSAAQSIVAQHDEHDFVLSFFDVRLPILLGDDAEREALLRGLDSIPAVCVARIQISASRMPELIEVLQQNLANWQRKIDEAKETSDVADG